MPESYDRGVRVVGTAEDYIEYYRSARDLAAEMLVEDSSNVSSTRDTQVRSILPATDLNAGEDTEWDEDDPVWQQEGPGGSETGDTIEVYAFDKDDRMDDKTAVIYGLRDLGEGGLESEVSQVVLRNATGGKIEQYDISGLSVAEDEDYKILFENPIALRENKSLYVEFVVGSDPSDPVDTQVQLLGEVAEEAGNELEESSRFVTSQSSRVN